MSHDQSPTVLERLNLELETEKIVKSLEDQEKRLKDVINKKSEAHTKEIVNSLEDQGKTLTDEINKKTEVQTKEIVKSLEDQGNKCKDEISGKSEAHTKEIFKSLADQGKTLADEINKKTEAHTKEIVKSLEDQVKTLKDELIEQFKVHTKEIVKSFNVLLKTMTDEINKKTEADKKEKQDAKSKLESVISYLKDHLASIVWIIGKVALVVIFISIVLAMLLQGKPSGAAVHKLTVVTFASEAYDQSGRVIPELLGQATPTSGEVMYKMLTGELDLSQIPSSDGYIVVIGYDARNSILEDMDGSMGSRKRETIVGLQKGGRDVLVMYIEHDHRRNVPKPDSLYNTHLSRPTSHPILRQLVDNQRFLSLHQWEYTQHQAQHVRDWVSRL